MGSPESIGRRMILDAGLLKILRLSAGPLRSAQKKARSAERALRVLSETRAGT